jgi:chromosome partitioning protein
MASDTLVIGVQNPKGGTGKTTIAVNLARALQLDSRDVLIIDTDPQRSAVDWRERSPDGYDGPDVASVTEPKDLRRRTRRIARSYDVAVVDGAARLQGMTGAVIAVSDVLLVPVQPSGLDFTASTFGRFVDLALEKKSDTGTPAVAFVASRRIVGTNLEDQLPDALGSYGVPILEGTAQRVAYVHSANAGRAVVDGYDAKAADEIRTLAKQAMKL